jgi:hypothetical protein
MCKNGACQVVPPNRSLHTHCCGSTYNIIGNNITLCPSDAAKRHVPGAVAGVVAGEGTWDDLPYFARHGLEVSVVEVAKWRCGVLLTTMHDSGLSSYGLKLLLRMSRHPMQTRAATANTPPQHTPPPYTLLGPVPHPLARTEGRRRRRCLATRPPSQRGPLLKEAAPAPASALAP